MANKSKRIRKISLFIGLIAAVFGFLETIGRTPEGDSQSEINSSQFAVDTLFKAADSAAKSGYFFPEIAWSRMVLATGNLIPENRDKVEAMALVRLFDRLKANLGEEKAIAYVQEKRRQQIAPWNSELWNDRILVAASPWREESLWARLDDAAFQAGWVFIVALLISFPCLWLISWAWYFWLERLVEVVAVFRGQTNLQSHIILPPSPNHSEANNETP